MYDIRNTSLKTSASSEMRCNQHGTFKVFVLVEFHCIKSHKTMTEIPIGAL